MEYYCPRPDPSFRSEPAVHPWIACEYAVLVGDEALTPSTAFANERSHGSLAGDAFASVKEVVAPSSRLSAAHNRGKRLQAA
ncbi:hypothetical protein [Ferrimicrobium sp.]|uniref:hypothetical protein n=1 Tax=Ferrimicrobium sp. TaxID=2926050 RepID=UPI0026159C32|nr:hypothetical protein [Ferrimicrobium sp.]